LLLMVLLTCLIVVLRYLFNIGFIWMQELVRFFYSAVFLICAAYTLAENAHVRVDIFYSRVSFQTKKIIDMFGSLFFMVPMSVILWMYSWFFMWRHLITPKVSATDKIELLIRKSKIVKWNVETIGFSPNGFSAYFLFKILIIALVALIFIQAISFFWRSFLEWKEGENSENKYLELEKFDEFSNVSEK